MFKNHTFQTKIVKDKKVVTVAEPSTVNIINAPSNMMRDAILGAGALYTIKIAVDTSAKIALHIATK